MEEPKVILRSTRLFGLLSKFSGPHPNFLVMAAICLIAFVAITVISDQIFEHVPHSEDEVAYIFQAKVFAQNRLAVPTPIYHHAFWTPFVLDYEGQRFGKYPPGWPFLLSFGIRLNAPWLINALLATCTLALIAWLGDHFYGAKCGLKSTIAEIFQGASMLGAPWGANEALFITYRTLANRGVGTPSCERSNAARRHVGVPLV